MPDKIDRLLGEELARAAGALLAESDPVRLATVQALLALYWELRHDRPAADPDPSLAWLSALLCAGLPAYVDLPERG